MEPGYDIDTVNSKLDWNDNLAATLEAKLIFYRTSSSASFHCICRRSLHNFSGNVPEPILVCNIAHFVQY